MRVEQLWHVWPVCVPLFCVVMRYWQAPGAQLGEEEDEWQAETIIDVSSLSDNTPRPATDTSILATVSLPRKSGKKAKPKPVASKAMTIQLGDDFEPIDLDSSECSSPKSAEESSMSPRRDSDGQEKVVTLPTQPDDKNDCQADMVRDQDIQSISPRAESIAMQATPRSISLQQRAKKGLKPMRKASTYERLIVAQQDMDDTEDEPATPRGLTPRSTTKMNDVAVAAEDLCIEIEYREVAVFFLPYFYFVGETLLIFHVKTWRLSFIGL